MPARFGNVLLCVLPEILLLTGLEQVCQVPESMASKQSGCGEGGNRLARDWGWLDSSCPPFKGFLY